MHDQASSSITYENPPLNEVVLGIQFSAPKEYQQIYSFEVWQLFKDTFPRVEELPPLTPKFETFGLPQRGHVEFDIIKDSIHSRFWFVSEAGDELIQFQSDRFLHNWRKVGDKTNTYPRFNKIIKDYESELKKLKNYFSKFDVNNFNVNQCELTYINYIPLEEKNGDKISDWINLLNLKDVNPDDVSVVYRRVLKNSEGKPYGRLNCEINQGINKENNPIIVLNITVRGKPSNTDVQSAIKFLEAGNKLAVNCFEKITTDFAHKQWRRKR